MAGSDTFELEVYDDELGRYVRVPDPSAKPLAVRKQSPKATQKRRFEAKQAERRRANEAATSNMDKLGSGIASIPGRVVKYIKSSSPSSVGRDVKGLAKATYDAAVEDPNAFIEDAIAAPFAAIRDFGDVRETARKLRAQGRDAEAEKMEAMAGTVVLSAVPILGRPAGVATRKAIKAAEKTAVKGATKGAEKKAVKKATKAAEMAVTPSTARLKRAQEQGFNTELPLYHGTSSDFPEFSAGREIFLTDKPDIANIYAVERGKDKSRKYGPSINSDPNVRPVFAKMQKPLIVSDVGPDGSHGWLTDNMAAALGIDNTSGPKLRGRALYDEARRQGYDTVQIENMLDLGGEQTQYVPLSPDYIKSQFDNFEVTPSAKVPAAPKTEFERPSVSPIATQAGERGLPLRGQAQTQAQHPSKFGVFSSYKTPTPVEETVVVAEPYAVLPRDRMFDTNRLEGAKIVSLYGDRERAGDTILRVNDHPTNVDTQGGAMFPALQEALGSEGAWASEYGALGPVRRAVAEGLDAGQRVFGVTTAMGPGALNQTIDMTDLLHQMAATSPIRKSDLSVFNKRARDVLPGYAGLLHDEAAQQLHGMTQGQRKAFVALLDNAGALNQGFPNVPAARYALTDENLLDVPAGTSGYSFVEFGPESLKSLEGGIDHRSYPDRMSGTYEGRGPLVPFTTMFSDFAKSRRDANALAGSDLRAFELGKPSQNMTPEAYDLLMKYLQGIEDPY
jgi:hypothetical protein